MIEQRADAIAIAALEQQVKQLELADVDQWRALETLRDRLPNWVVSIMAAGGGVIGFLVHWLVTCLK